jgi:hypothetical protein
VNNEASHTARFSISPVKQGGPWVVVDDAKDKRLVATCSSVDIALMLAALMNGNSNAAIERRPAVIAALDSSA